eukprot:4233783-Prymnesium_polylepis.1
MHRGSGCDDSYAALAQRRRRHGNEGGMGACLDEIAALAIEQRRNVLKRSLEVDGRREPAAPVGGVELCEWLRRHRRHKDCTAGVDCATCRHGAEHAAVRDTLRVQVHRMVPRMRWRESLGVGIRVHPRLESF